MLLPQEIGHVDQGNIFLRRKEVGTIHSLWTSIHRCAQGKRGGKDSSR